jgi:hypothetical protein
MLAAAWPIGRARPAGPALRSNPESAFASTKTREFPVNYLDEIWSSSR